MKENTKNQGASETAPGKNIWTLNSGPHDPWLAGICRMLGCNLLK